MKDFLQDSLSQGDIPTPAPFGRVDVPGPSLMSVKKYVQSLGRGQQYVQSKEAQVYDLSNLFSFSSS